MIARRLAVAIALAAALSGCSSWNPLVSIGIMSEPANKPTPSEITHCRQFLAARIAALPKLRVILALGRIAHESTLDTLGLKRRDTPFTHGARHELATGQVLFDSYHCSRQNTNTGRLTTPMFEAVLTDIVKELGGAKRS